MKYGVFEIDFSDKGQFNLLALVAVILSSVIVSAVVLNETVNDSNEANTPALPDALVNEIAEQVINESIWGGLAVDEEIIGSYESEAAEQGLDAITGAAVGENEGITQIVEEDEIAEEKEINDTEVNQTESVYTTLNQTSESNLTKKDIKKLAKSYKNKLNNKTEEYLENIENKEEKKEYLILYKQSFDKSKIKDINKEYPKFNVLKTKINIAGIEELIGDSDIEYIELDQEIEALEDSIPFNIQNTNAPSAWDLTKGSDVKVAILDTGISPHPDLAVAGGYSAVSEGYGDNNGHGTAVAGVVSALSDDQGLVGIAPEASLYAVKIMEGSSGELSDAIEGIGWCIDNGMEIVSMSFGMETYSQIFKEVIQQAYDNNILLIAAAGNDGKDYILYPAAYDDVIAVGAVNQDNEKALFSNYGFELELVAPGVGINTTHLDEGYTVVSGTSFAAPHVAGVAALIKSYNESLTNEQIRAKLRNDALDLGEEGKDDHYGYGLVHVDLETQDYTIENLSYYYEVFNITNFRNDDETRVFWVSGFGTIDDVGFSQGYYAVNKTINNEVKNDLYYVDENGILKLLLDEAFFYDDFSEESSSTEDGITWINGMLKVYLENPSAYVDAECWDFNWNDVEEYTECYYDDAGDYSSCISYSQVQDPPDGYSFYYVCAEKEGQGGYTCDQGIEQNHSLDTSSIELYNTYMVDFIDCDDSVGDEQTWESDASPAYVIDKKRAHCTGEINFDYQGRYESGSPDQWITYKSTSCTSSKVCGSELDDQNVTTKTGSISDPCRYCTSGSDCASNNCSGAKTEYKIYCWYDGSLNANKSDKVWNNSCNGSGVVSQDWEWETWFFCGGGSVCDDDHDDIGAESPPTPCRRGIGSSCNQSIQCWNDNLGYYCTNGYCSKCGDSSCSNGEDYSSCPEDCCYLDYCTGVGGEGGDGVCHSSCDGYNYCGFYNTTIKNICNGQDQDSYQCIGQDARVLCCEGTPQNCGGDEYCSSGSCLTCNTQCNDNCQSSACYGDDPDCDSNGAVNGNCGDGICCQETSGSCPQDCGSGETKCNGTINIVTSSNDLNIKVDSVYEDQTDYYYFLQKAIINATCGSSYNVDVYCSDNSTLCYSETTYINTNGETATVVDSDCYKTCSTDANFWLTNADVEVDGSNINVTIHSSNLNGNVNITIYRVNGGTGLKDGSNSSKLNINPHSSASQKITLDLSSASALNVYIDEPNEFNEDKNDNFVYRVIAEKTPKAYLSINTSYPDVDSLIENYLKQYVESVSSGHEELIISVGKFTDEFKQANPETLKSDGTLWWKTQGWGYKNGGIFAYGEYDYAIYSGIVGRTDYTNKPLILAYGLGVDGDIASAKKLISARNLMFEDFDDPEKPPVVMDKYDVLALGINNLLKGFTNYSSPAFLKVVNKILFDNTYDVAIRTVRTLDDTSYGYNTTLRLKNVNADYSDDFKDAISNSEKPVVFSGGIFNDLKYWEESSYDFFGFEHLGLARELANEGRDTWEIEMNSGPTTDECPNQNDCPNYNYSDMVNFYWPVLIAAVQNYTEQDSLAYVGYSQGCRVALDSLETFEDGSSGVGYYFNYDNGQYELVDLKANPVDTFVGVGCSGTFRGYSFFQDYFGKYGDDILAESGDKNHISNSWLGERLLSKCNWYDPDDFPYCQIAAKSLIPGGPAKSISKNSSIYYLNAIKDNSTKQPGESISLDELLVIYGQISVLKEPYSEQDGLASANDSIEIFDGINANAKQLEKYNLKHTEFEENNKVRKSIKNFLEGG